MADYRIFLQGDKLHAALISANDEALCRYIGKARKEISFVGSGISNTVAQAIAAERDLVKFIAVDDSDDVFRQGLGSAKALALLRDAGVRVLRCGTVRINILHIDDEVLTYAPTAQCRQRETLRDEPNGVAMEYSAVKEIMDYEIQPASTEEQYQAMKEWEEASGALPAPEPKIQMSEISDASIGQHVEEYGKVNPNEELVLNVYTGLVKFVEFRLTGVRIDRRKVTIPKKLMQLIEDEPDTLARINASYSLFQHAEEITERSKGIDREFQAMKREFLVRIPDLGMLCRSDQKESLEEAVKTINDDIQQFKQQVEKDIRKEIQTSIQRLKNIFSRIAAEKEREQESCTPIPTPEAIQEQLEEAFPDPENYTKDMGLTVIFKDVTYDMLKSPKFESTLLQSDFKTYLMKQGLIRERVIEGRVVGQNGPQQR